MTKEQVYSSFKVVVTGDRNTGKTSLVTRLTKATLGAEFKTKNVVNVKCQMKGNDVQLCIWDLAGGQEYHAVSRSAYHDASGILLLYDVSDRATFENCVGWLKEIRSSSSCQMMLIGNKCDLDQGRTVTTEEAQAFATDNGVLFLETSALSGHHIELAFQQMATYLFYNKPQQEPFQVVLIDIKKAAHDEMIRCVKRPLLEETNLKYVAISYRWGETQETTVDTQVGYLASITSFALQDFYDVCKALTMDPDTSSIEYVWVDAICVNQANYQQRKLTIQHMTDIYERATWILAVPDLHAAYLREINAYTDTMSFISDNKQYIYHLLHGNFGPLDEYDALFLDSIKTPKNASFRRLLTKYTDCFAVSFLEYQEHHRFFYSKDILHHLFADTYPHSSAFSLPQRDKFDNRRVSRNMDRFREIFTTDMALVEHEVQTLHRCHNSARCPLKYIPIATKKTFHQTASLPRDGARDPPQQRIYQRGAAIRRSVHFLSDLVKDWSTRVWVISEFHIAKRKHNLKFWFTQLMHRPRDDPTATITLYNLNVSEPKPYTDFWPPSGTQHVSDAVYLMFYGDFIRQLNGRVFLEMILQSNATKNEDRFYAIFPQFSEYKHLLTNDKNEDLVKSWEITSILSVKLKLYELMTNNDKLYLLFMSDYGQATHTLPTFATSNIPWGLLYPFQDMEMNITVTLCKDEDYDHGLPLYYLNLKVPYYDIARSDSFTEDSTATCSWDYFLPHHLKETLYNRLNFNDDGVEIDVVLIRRKPHSTGSVCCLIGSFERNIWVLRNCAIAGVGNLSWDESRIYGWNGETDEDYCGSFNIY